MKNIYPLIFAILILVGGGNTALAKENIAAIAAPVINIAPLSYYPLEEMLYLEGRAEPARAMEILFNKSDSQPVRISVKSNSNGEWFFGERLELDGGDWTVRARIASGSQISDWSNPRIVRSIISGFTVGAIKIKYLPVAIALALLFAVGFALLIYAFIRARKIKYADRATEMERKAEDLRWQLRNRELRSAKDLVEKNFSDLRRDLLGELEHLERRSKDGALTKAEEAHRENMSRQLRHMEEDIKKQIKDLA